MNACTIYCSNWMMDIGYTVHVPGKTVSVTIFEGVSVLIFVVELHCCVVELHCCILLLRPRTLRNLSSIQPLAECIPFPGVYQAS